MYCAELHSSYKMVVVAGKNPSPQITDYKAAKVAEWRFIWEIFKQKK